MARDLVIEIVGDASKLNRELASAQTATTGFATKFKKAALVAGAAGAGIAAVGVGLKKTVDAALESEKAQQRLESALKGAGVSMDKYGDSIQKNIDKTSRLAALDDEDLSDSFAKLIRTTGDVTKATDGMNLAADIARARNISLEASTKMVERALSGNESAFSRIGLKLDATATSQDVLAEAQKRFGGAAEEYGKTSAAAQERLGVAFENIQELIGEKVLPVLATLAEKLLGFLNWVLLNWPKFQQVMSEGLEKAKATFDKVSPVVNAFADTVKALVRTVAAVFSGDWDEAWKQFKKVVEGALTLVKELLALAWEGFKKAAVALGGAILEGVKEGLTGIGMAAWNVINNIHDRIIEFRDSIIGWGASVAKSIVKGLVEGLAGLGDAIVEKIKEAFDWVRDHMPKLPSIDIPFIGGDARNPNMTHPGGGGGGGGINLMGASPVMMPFAVAAQGLGLRVSSGLRPGAITANGTPSDHGIGKALDLAGAPSAMGAFFKALLGNPAVKQAFYDPLGSIFGGAWSSYREGGHSDHVHVATYDTGGVLKPGWTMAYNGTGRNEYVSKNADGGPYYLVLPDGKVLAELVRSENAAYARANG